MHCGFQKDEKVTDDEHDDEVPINNLPTELLVLIFSWLSVQDLSQNIARVCTRWRDTLTCKMLWQDKEVLYEIGEEKSFVFILGVAVSLKRLILTPIACEHPKKMVNAILRGPKDVQEFHYNLSLFPVETGARILKHFKENVRELHLVGYLERPSALQRNLSSILQQMSQLQTLKLSGYFDTKWDIAILNQGCWTLQHFDVSEIHDECDSYLPLLDSVKRRLKTLKLPRAKSPPEVLSSVSHCLELNEITLCLDDLRCISSLNSLEALHIKWAHEAPRSKLNKFIRECHVFKYLKELTLYYIPGPIALAIVKQCHLLKCLSIHGITTCYEIIKCVPSVEQLRIVDHLSLRPHHMATLPNLLPRLKLLDVRGCFMSLGVHPRIINEMKNQLPGLDIRTNAFASGANKSSESRNDGLVDASHSI